MFALIDFLLLLVQVVLIARAIVDWAVVFAGPPMPGSFRSRAAGVLHTLTEPLLRPVRRVIPPINTGGVSIDLAFIVLFFAIVLIRAII